MGQSWKERIEESLDEVTFLIPIITPNFFKSLACRKELEQFIEREKNLQRSDLILPVYYIECDQIHDQRRHINDEIAQIIDSRQYADWRELRFKSRNTQEFKKAISQLAKQIHNALKRTKDAHSLDEDRSVDQQEIPNSPNALMINSEGKPNENFSAASSSAETNDEVEKWKNAAVYWHKSWFFEKASTSAYSGQVNILKNLFTKDGYNDLYLNLFEKFFSIDFFERYFNGITLTPIQYFNYMKNSNFIIVEHLDDVNTKIYITSFGAEFLGYINKNNYESLYTPAQFSK